MKRKPWGFTLVELLIVIVILILFAAIAIPKYKNLSTDAKTAAVNSTAALLSSANAVNYTMRKANPAKGNAITNCTDVALILLGGLPKGYTITAAIIPLDTTVSCTLNGARATGSFSATGIN